MRKLIMSLAIVSAVSSASAFAQTVSGGQAPQADGSIRSTDLGGNGSATSQYLQQRALNNLPAAAQPKAVRGNLGASRPAKREELTVGAIINDKIGTAMAKIDRVDPDGVIISTAIGKVKVPAEAFGHNRAGLLLDTTKSDFDKIVAQAK